MGENSRIDWTDHTWNCWQGCTKVGPGCKNCYCYREQKRYGLDPSVVRRSSTQTFRKPLKWNKKREPQLVFVCSWSDFFHPDADAWRDEAWEIIRRCKNLTFQILTKRSDRIKDHLPKKGWPVDFLHVWLGVSVENKDCLHRIDDLIETEALVKFISAEPLLEAITPEIDIYMDELDWVIVGGESGPDCRPMSMNWAREIRNHCEFFKVPFFLKQLGGHPNKRSGAEAWIDGNTQNTYQEMPHIWKNESQKFSGNTGPITNFTIPSPNTANMYTSAGTDAIMNFNRKYKDVTK